MSRSTKRCFISDQQVKKILNPGLANRLVQTSFTKLNDKDTQIPPKIYLKLPRGDFRAMPVAYKQGRKLYGGLKWICVYPRNAKSHLPSVIGHIMLNDMHTGALLAIIEANTLTAYRTGAAGAVASKYLAKPNPKSLLLIGAGIQAAYQLACHAKIYNLQSIEVWSREPKEVKTFITKHKRMHPQLRAVQSLAQSSARADIICTCTPSTKPILKSHWIKAGTHINAIGADAPGKQELDLKLLKRSKIFIDEWTQAAHAGEINKAVSRNIIKKRNITGTLTQAILSKKRNRNPHDITIFDSTGLAIQDLILAQTIYNRCP